MSTATQLPPNVQPIRASAIPAAAFAEEPFDLRRLLAMARRRKALIVGMTMSATVLAVLWVNQITPLYRAEAMIVVEPDRKQVVKIDQVVQNLNPDWLTAQTEAAVIRSRTVALMAVERLDLTHHPAFNPALAPPRRTMGSVLRDWAGLGLVTIGLARDPAPAAVPADNLVASAPKPEDLVGAYLGGLEATPIERSRLIRIVYTSTDPLLAAAAANVAAELYIEQQQTSKGNATIEANSWLDRRVGEVHAQVIEAQRKRDEFRREAGIVELSDSSIFVEQLALLNARLVEARTARQQTEARHQQVQKLLGENVRLDTVPDVAASSLIQNLRLQEAEVAREIAELGTQYRDGHPKMVLARAELKDIRDKVQSEVRNIANQIRYELELARVTEANLQSEVSRLQQRVEEQNDARVTLDLLEAELQASKQLYETLLSRYKETEVQDRTLQRDDARILSAAVPPGGPFYPQKMLLSMIALVASLVGSILLALALEVIDTGFRSLAQIESLTGLPTLGMVPKVKQRRGAARAHEIAAARPGSAYGEAIRTIRTAVFLAESEHPPRTLLITSSVPGEGKTSTALAIASQTARSGQRCILIDCDLRQSSLSRQLGGDDRVGLGEFLAGKARLEEVIEVDPLSGAHFLIAGGRTNNPVDLLGSPQMKRLLTALATAYDLVVLDTPPVLAVSDALVLVRTVDATVFLVRWEKTRRQSAASGLKLALEAGANLVGVALTQVDARRHAQYDYGDSGYYYGYHKYYTE